MNGADGVLESTPPSRLLPPKALLPSLLAQIPLVMWSWPHQLPRVPALLGIAMLVTGIAVNIWADRLFRKNGVGVCPFSPVPSLVNKGPYRFTRNPMYIGLVQASSSVIRSRTRHLQHELAIHCHSEIYRPPHPVSCNLLNAELVEDPGS